MPAAEPGEPVLNPATCPPTGTSGDRVGSAPALAARARLSSDTGSVPSVVGWLARWGQDATNGAQKVGL
jgi:hypothetical protein